MKMVIHTESLGYSVFEERTTRIGRQVMYLDPHHVHSETSCIISYFNVTDEIRYMNDAYFILDGHNTVPATLDEWVSWFGSHSRRVAETNMRDAKGNLIYRVSTVFLGLNHSFYEGEPPLLFETMVFDADANEVRCVRCTTWDEAVVQHDNVVAECVQLLEEKDADYRAWRLEQEKLKERMDEGGRMLFEE